MIDVTPFQTEIKAIEERFLLEVDALLNRLSTLSKEEQLILLREIDFMTRLNTQGLDGVLSKMSSAMTAEVGKLRKLYTAEGFNVTATFTPLAALVQEDLNMFINQYKAYSSTIKQNLIQGIAANTPKAVLVSQLTSLTTGNLSSKQASFLMSETFSRFDSAVKATVFEGKEKIVKWEYLGPVDNRNRDACASLMARGGIYTMDEINNGEAHPDIDFVSRGGFNCRHHWEVAEEQPEGAFA